ncbi:ABC transporter substrate-binding protein [Paenibacillus sp. TRM 82003]|uniref:ABC transporter substrate-binding protein n=1 Tax=Kineococcus sp. TRM81007 TaxID=2925831 RepID=UPI001F590B4F|nr:ABC transporter substrate-binding protein [Kineococcus sp. TRM81007]MCI2237128.1 ABC transporter substrate-binding protein [Kineococcus sp. TRM81007]MCI3926401.1 ABC transporter substrate-binding protein [Paenibacillus sp. TRM 82003]
MPSSTPTRPRAPRRAVLAGAGGLALLALTACSGGTGRAAEPAPAAATSTPPAARTVTTEQGTVEVPGDPQRIAVLSGSLAGYLFALDAPVVATDTRVLGVTDLQGGFPPAWADEATAQGTTALPAGEELNVEAVAAARPDLIIGGGQGITAVQAQEAYEQLSDIAPTVLVPAGTTNWQEQLELVAEATGRTDGVDEIVSAYDAQVEQVRSSITVPDGNAVFLLSLPVGKPFVIPADAALPALAEEVGFTPDDVLTKAGDPTLYGSGDSFEVSPELLGQVADAPVAFVVALGGPSAQELAQDPVYAALPAFRDGQVHELPATSYRPDHDGAVDALEAIAEQFGA